MIDVQCTDPPDKAYPALLQGVSVDQQMDNFLDKLKQCSYIYKFNDEFDDLGDNLRGKEVKRDCLIEILDYMACSKFLISHNSYKAIVDMISSNLFSTVSNDRDSFDPENSQPKFDRDWPHHSFVCEILLAFLESDEFQVVVGRRYITEEFTGQIFDKLRSEDHRVRDAIKNIVHRIYSNIFDRRKYIKTCIMNVLLKFIYEKEVYAGINELMEMVTSIVNGFALPIRTENLIFIERVLIPLHSCQTITYFHDHVANCMAMLIAKQDDLAGIIIPRLLKLWPKNHENKVMLFLAEIELIFELLSPEQFQNIMEPVFKRLAIVIESDHYFNCEKVLYMFNIQSIMEHIERNNQILIPILFPALYNASKVNI